MSIIKTCHLYPDSGSNIYLGELLVGHKASISSLPFTMICAVITFEHVIIALTFYIHKLLPKYVIFVSVTIIADSI